VVVLLVDSAGTFLQNTLTRVGLPVVGRLTMGHALAGHAVVGCEVEFIFLFLKELEIVL
jgi:hypothetical protein